MKLNPVIDILRDDNVHNGYHQLSGNRWGAICTEEGMFLYGLIRCLRPETLIETGAGYSTLFIAQAVKDNGSGKHVAVDNNGRIYEWIEHAIQDAHLEWVCDVFDGDIFDVIPNRVKDPIDFAFMDASHEKESLLKESEMISSMLSPNAVVVGHDAQLSELQGVYDEVADRLNRNLTIVPSLRGIALMTPKEN